MSKKISKWSRIICLAILCGIGVVQLIYAMLWAINNGNNVQDFYDAAIYIENAQSLCGDGWRLLGYSYLVRFCMLFEGMLGPYYITLLYIFQLMCSLICFSEGIGCIAECVFHKKLRIVEKIFSAVYIITLPIVWQMQFAVLPDALCLAISILIFAKVTEIITRKCEFVWCNLLVIGGGWLLLGILHRHYMYGITCFIALSIVIKLFIQFNKKYFAKKNFLTAVVMLCMLILIPLFTNMVNDVVPQNREYASYSVGADLWKRCVYPYLSENYTLYPQSVRDIVSYEDVVENSEFYEQYMSGIGVLIENSSADANDIYWEITETGFSANKMRIFKSTIKEMVYYCFMPFAMQKNMYNNVNSLYGYNYMRMYEQCPGLTADYMHIGMNGFGFICALGILQYILRFVIEKESRRRCINTIVWCALAVVCVTLPMLLFAFAKFDYRIGLFSTFMWGMSAILVCIPHSLKKSE